MHFYYDYSDEIVGFEYFDGTTLSYYAYIKNMQGDVISIIDSSGNRIADYSYDAWGKLKSATSGIGLINPIRYRGYYYDTEISMYYLQSRYYDPNVGRFINADDTDYIGYTETMLSYNIFAYCDNDSINKTDPTGQWNIRDTEKRNNHKYFIHSNINYQNDINKTLKSNVFGKMIKENYFKNAKKLWNTVILWDEYADDLFASHEKYYTAPFHNKTNAAEIIDVLMNYSIWFKKRAGTNQKNINITFSKKKSGRVLLDGILKTKWKPAYKTQSAQIAVNKEFYPSTKNKQLITELNKLNNKKKSAAFLGLALHTIQDYFAHQAKVYYSRKNNNGTYGEYKVDTSHNVFKNIVNAYSYEDIHDKLKYRHADAQNATDNLILWYKYETYIRHSCIRNWPNTKNSYCEMEVNGYKLKYIRKSFDRYSANTFEPTINR